jgi:hypothetical protein
MYLISMDQSTSVPSVIMPKQPNNRYAEYLKRNSLTDCRNARISFRNEERQRPSLKYTDQIKPSNQTR